MTLNLTPPQKTLGRTASTCLGPQEAAPGASVKLEGAATYICDLAKKNSEALSFIPKPRLERYVEDGQVLLAHENGEPCGFIIHGNTWPQMRVYQACIQYDARRRDHGLALVAQLAAKAREAGCSDVRLWCADDLEANSFWAEAGFEFCVQRNGGSRRGRKHNLWALRLSEPPLLAALGALSDGPKGQGKHPSSTREHKRAEG